jgi:glyoxylase-like metal-dependent hydrolase (beta-lactamase superfamily II)
VGASATGWQELADGVFRWRYPFLDQNIGLVLGDGEALVIDTRSSHRHAAELQRDIRAVTELPWRTVVNTHGHWDHCFGNAAFRGAAIWAQAGCVAFIERTADVARLRVAEAIPEIADDLRAVEILLPDRPFADVATLLVGGRPVTLRHAGRGHTDHDLVLTVADAGVTFMGDLVEEGAPPSFGDSYPLDWPGTLAILMPLLEATIVPGHGDVVDAAFVLGQADELKALADLARQAIRDGEPLEIAAQRGPYPPDVSLQALLRAAAQLADAH